MPSRFRAAVVSALAAALLLAAPPLRAQAPAPEGGPALGPVVSLSGSVLTPLTPLTESDVSFDTELSSSAGASATLTWWLTDRVGVAGRGTWAPAKLNLRGVPPGAAVPDDLGDADYLAATVEGHYRFPLRGAASMLEPFVAVGGGVRDLSLDPVAAPEARSATDLVLTAAGGTSVRVWERTSLRLEVRDLVSEFDAGEGGRGTWQHDVLVSVGLSYRP